MMSGVSIKQASRLSKPDVRLFVYFKIPVLIAIILINFIINISPVIMAERLVSVNFEVYGKVQGVFFRKYTQQEAKKLNLRGWCMNTEAGTVQGVLEGDSARVDQMKHWLRKTGSPASRIEKALFTDEREIKSYTYEGFKVKR